MRKILQADSRLLRGLLFIVEALAQVTSNPRPKSDLA